MIKDNELIELENLLLQRDIEKAKIHFWSFCQLLEPQFYKDSRPHLRTLCDTLEAFHYNQLKNSDGNIVSKLMIRMPPQFGKSRTLVNFTKWSLGRNNEERIITASRSDSLAADFARYTRDGISEVKNIKSQIVFSDIFPNTKIKQGDGSVQKWALEGQHFNYLGVGVSGGVTGKGATLRIIDDIVKDAETALNDNALNKIWVWLSGTFSSRNSAEEGEVKEIFCATLWGENDPQAILEKTELGEWYILSMPIYDASKDKMLCSDFMNKKQFLKLKHRMEIDSRTKMIFNANYLCEALSDDETKVFPVSSLKRYKDFPENVEYFTIAFADTADQGDNYFAMPIARVYGSRVYVFDAIHDQDNLTIQEGQVIDKIKTNGIKEFVIETNSFGAYFKRRISEIMPDLYIFGQPAKTNKMGRILANAGLIKYHFYFPENPNPVLQKGMNQMCKLMKTSTKEDDFADAMSGLSAYLEKFYNCFIES
jgi:predicted phage terminase large subunit-like protein